jgi:hypothetical protein
MPTIERVNAYCLLNSGRTVACTTQKLLGKYYPATA